MLKRIIRLAAVFTLLAAPFFARAQAPTSLTPFGSQVLRLRSLTNPLGGILGGELIRLFPANTVPSTNGTAILSGQLIGSGNPTNVVFSQLDAARVRLRMTGSNGPSFLATNDVTLHFTSATAGFFTNAVFFSTVPQWQTNAIGTFELIAGTNAIPAITHVEGGAKLQLGNSVSLSGFGNGFSARLQWHLNGQPVADKTNSNLSIGSLAADQFGDYTLVMSNELGRATSAVVKVELAAPITVTQQPVGQTVMSGSYVTLSAAATGDMKGQTWLLNGSTALGIATNGTYVIPQINSTRAGSYTLQFAGYGTDSNGYPFVVNSSPAVVTVRDAGQNATWLGRPFVKIADDRSLPVPGQTGHVFTNWINGAFTPLLTFRDGKVHFVAGTSAGVRSLFRWDNGTLSTLVFTNTPNPLGGVFGDIFYPTDEGDGTVNFYGNSAVNGGMFAISNGIVANIIGSTTTAPERSNPLGGAGSFGRRNKGVAMSATIFSSPGSFQIVGTGLYFHDGSVLSRICDDTTDLPGALTGYSGRPTANSVNFDGTTIVFSTVTGGGPGGFFKSTPGGAITKLADHTDTLPENPAATFTQFGDLDVDGGLIFGAAGGSIYAFDANNVATNIGFGTAVSAAGPRMAYYQGGNQVFRWNDGVTETAFAGGLVDNKSVSSLLGFDAQGDDLVVLLKFADNSHGIYIVRGTTSALPVIVSEPLDYNVIENGSASFWATGGGQGPLGYQWFKDGGIVPGQTNASLFFNQVAESDVAGYSVVVANASGSVTSRVAQLTRTIPPSPTILRNPTFSPSTIFAGSNASVSVVAAGQNLAYQWYKNGAAIPGANTNFLSFQNVGLSDRTNYFVVLSTPSGVLTSSVASLAISPLITTQPISVTNLVGGTASFTVVAEGIAPLTYAWRRGSGNPNTVVAGATGPTLTVSNLTLASSMNYRVIVTSSAGGGSIGSQVVRLQVLEALGPDSPHLVPVLVSGGQFQFLLPTQTGYSYQIQTKTNLSDLLWTTNSTVTGDGTVKTVTIDASPDQKWVRAVIP